jgi:hypothetical protein
MFLTSSIARATAESMWGRGGTATYKTNRKGAYYFSCSSHGGFVISAKALTSSEYEDIAKYATPEILTVYVDNETDSVLLAFHPFRRKSGKIRCVGSKGYRIEEEKVFLLEEDCAWAIAVKFANIIAEGMTKESAESTFYNWFDENNPVVASRARVSKLRAEKDADLIIAATGIGKGLVKVWTADDKEHVVKGYDKSRDEFGNPWLSKCEIVEMEVA